MQKRRSVSTRAVYEIVKRRLETSGEAPTIAEICKAVNSAPATVHAALVTLEKQRVITRIPNISRGLALVNQQPERPFAIDGFEDEEEDADSALLDLTEAREQQPRRFVSPDINRAYSRYLSDWKQRMSSWAQLQREYM